MHISLRQLRLFHALADLGSMAAVARSLHLSQPAVSIQLRQLSESVGMPLYEQIGKKLHLTDAGHALAATCRDLATRWDAFEMEIADLQGLKRGTLRLAVVSTAKYFVPRLLGPFCAQFPEIDVHLEVANRDQLVQRLEQNLDDLSIMAIPPAHLALEREEFLRNPLVVVAPSSHPLAAGKGLTLADLAGERFILREPGSGTRIATEHFMAAQGATLNVKLSLGSNEAIKQAVAGGLGLSVLSRHTLGKRPAEEGLVVLDVAQFPIDARWYWVWPQGKRLSPLARAFHDFASSDAGRALLAF